MDETHILHELITLLEKLTIPVKQDRGDFKGGLVRYHDEHFFYINRKAEIPARIALILEELKGMHVPDDLLTDELRRYLESAGIAIEKNSVDVT